MAIDPWARAYQTLGDLGKTYNTQYERKRRAPLDALAMAKGQQALEEGDMRLDALKRQNQSLQDWQALQEKLEGGKTVKEPSAQTFGGYADGPYRPGAQVTRTLPYTEADKRNERREFLMKEGKIGEAMQMDQAAQQKFNFMTEAIVKYGPEMAANLISRTTGKPLNSPEMQAIRNAKITPTSEVIYTDPTGQNVVGVFTPGKGFSAHTMASPRAAGAGAAMSPNNVTKVQELAVGEDENGATLYQKYQWNPRTNAYDIPLGVPTPKGSFASQIDELSPDAVADKAILNIVGDKGGKVTGGRVSALANQRIENKASEIRNDLGIEEGDVILVPQDFKAYTKSYDNLQKRRNMAGTFVRNMDKQLEQFKDLTKKVSYEDPALLTLPWQKFQTYVQGNGDLAAYRALITDLSNEAAKLSSGAEASVAALTEGAANKWAGIHYEAMPTSEMLKLLDETVRIGQQRLESFDDEIKDLRGNINDLVKKPGEEVPLSQEMALKILEEAGGDKERARELAKERGFTF